MLGVIAVFLGYGIFALHPLSLVSALFLLEILAGMLLWDTVWDLWRTRRKMKEKRSKFPPILAEALIRVVAPREYREGLLGDLSEGYAYSLKSRHYTRSRCWYWGRALLFCLYLFSSKIKLAILEIFPKKEQAQ